jgi:hypothetical protein
MKFSYYDFNLTVPDDWKLLTEKKSEHGKGQVAFMPPKGDTSVDLLWESLDLYKSKGATVEAFIDNYFENLKKNRSLIDLETYKGELVKYAEHEMLLHEFKYTFHQMLRRGFTQRVIGIAMYDTHANRFAILYCKINKGKEGYENTVRDILKTFKCTCNETAVPTESMA